MRATAPPSWKTMMFERGEVLRAAWSTSVSIASSVSGGSSQERQR
jgi:hypothetical protein